MIRNLKSRTALTMKIISAFLLMLCLAAISCGKADEKSTAGNTEGDSARHNPASRKVTFVELGSVTCIPCRQMQPVMKAIEEKYQGQVEVVFHDVWKDKEAQKKYKIDLIPTQVFLDEKGSEFFRHEGFFPESEISKLLEKRGILPTRQ
jgi:thioredoxin 1